MISDAWTATWSQWGIWRFALVWMLVMGLAIAIPTAIVIVGVVRAIDASQFGWLIAGGVAFTLGLLATFPVSAAYVGGTIGMADMALRGGKPRFADGLHAAGRSWVRILGVQLAIGGVVLVAIAVLLAVGAGPLIAAFGSGNEEAIAGAVAGVFLGSIVLYVVVLFGSLAASVLGMPFLMSANGAIVLDGARVRDAFRQGWWAIRHNFKASVLASLVLFGISYGFSLVTSMVIQPLVYLGMTPMLLMSGPDQPDPTTMFTSFGLVFAVAYILVFLGSIPSTIFMYVGWVSFYRQITGRPTPAAQAAQAREFAAGAVA